MGAGTSRACLWGRDIGGAVMAAGPGGLITLILWLASLFHTGSSCNKEQVVQCRHAAEKDLVSKLPGGGKCSVNNYVAYTHLCTVNNYNPSIDHCCCMLDMVPETQTQKVLCCRYHQSWDRYRCDETHDTIATFSPSVLPPSLLIPVIVVPIILAAFILACCVYRCYRKHSNRKKRRKEENSMVPYSYGRQIGQRGEMEPLNGVLVSQDGVLVSPDGVLLSEEEKQPLDTMYPGVAPRVEPSAPPPSSEDHYRAFHHHHQPPHHHPLPNDFPHEGPPPYLPGDSPPVPHDSPTGPCPTCGTCSDLPVLPPPPYELAAPPVDFNSNAGHAVDHTHPHTVDNPHPHTSSTHLGHHSDDEDDLHDLHGSANSLSDT